MKFQIVDAAKLTDEQREANRKHNEAMMEAWLGPKDVQEARTARVEALYNSGIIEWHCQGRHGVVRNVARADENAVYEMLEYYFGSKCAWGTKSVKGHRDIEFVHMTKVSPRPTKPWQWCGTSVLFADWQGEEDAAYEAAGKFRLGDRVSFEHKGQTLTGVVTGGSKRVAVLVGYVKWYVPGTQLTKVQG